MSLNMNEFLTIRGLGECDRVDVNGLQLQTYIRKCIETEAKLEASYDVEEAKMKEISDLKDEIKELKKTNKYLLEASRTNDKLVKENDDLRYKLGLSNMFLERRKEREALNAYRQNISVDLNV